MTRGRRGYSRRDFIKGASLAGAALSVAPIHQANLTEPPRLVSPSPRGPYLRKKGAIRKVFCVGMDGMDPSLMRSMMARGELPTFKKLSERGAFCDLQTTLPPQSPVAWASFITGADPGVHSIFDFVHRLPQTLVPYLSTSQTLEAAQSFRLGNWTIPLSSAEVKLMRKGVAVWDVLADAGIPSTVIQIPSNYPTYADSKLVHSISGMGTPDLLGTYGTFTIYSDQPKPSQAHRKEGRWVTVSLSDNVLQTSLSGPNNSFLAQSAPVEIPLRIERDYTEKILRITIEGETIVLQQGEWSRWVPLSFPLVPLLFSAKGMVRFFAKEVHPGFILYCSPINVDPKSPDLPISSPPEFAGEIAEKTDRYYTQGFPADTKALSAGAFSTEDFYHQSRLVLDESLLNFEATFKAFEEGFYFFYFSSLDQSSHMMWRLLDPTHPLYEADLPPEVKQTVPSYYKVMDVVLSRVLEREDSNTLVIALSDHGFSPFTREFNVSSWLVKEGYTVLSDESALGDLSASPYEHVDWLETKAYVCGINGIYINRDNREKFGVVTEEEAQRVKNEIREKLARVTDPRTGGKIFAESYDAHAVYTNPDAQVAPDIVLGYRAGYRISDEAVLGKFPGELVTDRTDLWSADHCVDPSVVPGMFISNKPLSRSAPGIWDVAPSILEAFGVPIPPEMTGKSFLKTTVA